MTAAAMQNSSMTTQYHAVPGWSSLEICRFMCIASHVLIIIDIIANGYGKDKRDSWFFLQWHGADEYDAQYGNNTLKIRTYSQV